MNRLVVKHALGALLLLLSFGAGAVNRTGADCTFPGTAPTSNNPLTLGVSGSGADCTVANGDDITRLLLDAANQYTSDGAAGQGALFIRAPATNMTLVVDTIDWSKTNTAQYGRTLSEPVKDFYFLEDSTATLTLAQPTSPADINTMFYFTNMDNVVLGGPNLNLTFQGIHAGLGTGDDSDDNRALIRVNTNDGSSPTLFDAKANFHDTEGHGIRITGGTNVGGTANRIAQVNIAGEYWNSSLGIANGAKDVYIDPNKTILEDPYLRAFGWDGVAAGTANGRKVGCYDAARKQYRIMQNVGNFIENLTGGIQLRYGNERFNIFQTENVGTSQSDPFVVYYRDVGASGPTARTGYPEGVSVRKAGGAHELMKHDGMPTFGHTSADFRWIKFIQLPSSWGNGNDDGSISSGCAPSNSTDNSGGTGYNQIWQAEATSSSAKHLVTAFIDVTFQDITQWDFNGSSDEIVVGVEGDYENVDGTVDRSYGHVMRAASGTSMPDAVRMHDTNTLTGLGSWNNVNIVNNPIAVGGTVHGRDNTITDTHINGIVDVNSNVSNTTITNVDFSGGGSRNILTVGTGSDVHLTNICVLAGSTMTGAGTVTYNGQNFGLPHTFNALNDCALGSGTTPLVAPSNLRVVQQ